jgi:hypothetical protein
MFCNFYKTKKSNISAGLFNVGCYEFEPVTLPM